MIKNSVNDLSNDTDHIKQEKKKCFSEANAIQDLTIFDNGVLSVKLIIMLSYVVGIKYAFYLRDPPYEFMCAVFHPRGVLNKPLVYS